MVTVKGTKSKRRPGKELAPKDGTSLGNVGHFKGAQPAIVVPGEKKKVVKPTKKKKIKPTVRGPSHAPQKAAAERFGDSISAVAPIEKDKGEEMPKKLMTSEPKAQTGEDAGQSIVAIQAVDTAKMSKTQTSERTPAVRFGDSIGAVKSMPKEGPKEKEKPKASTGSGQKAPQSEEKIEHSIVKIPAVKVAPVKEEPAEKVDAFDSGIGWVELKGKRYDFDIIVHVDGSVTKREKGLSKKKKEKYGHTPLTGSELKELRRESPVMIVIGTGQSGSMPLTPRAERFLEDYLYFIGKTPEALVKLATCEEKVMALLHVTC